MAYYENYIREKAQETFDIEKANFNLYDQDWNEMDVEFDQDLLDEIFDGAMCEMVKYIHERTRDKDRSTELLFDSENVDAIHISTVGLTAPIVIVEYNELPDWFQIEDADNREFYWHRKPGLSGDLTSGYFQFR
jgi:hypothetical protein